MKRLNKGKTKLKKWNGEIRNDIERRIQLSNFTKQRLRRNQKLKIYKTVVKSALTTLFNMGLTKAQIEKLDKAHRKQLRKLWNNPRQENRYVYRDSMEISLSIEMKKTK